MKFRTRLLAGGIATALALGVPGPGPRKAEAIVGVPFAPVAIGVLSGWLLFNGVHAIIRVSDAITLEAKDLIIWGAASGGIGFILGVILLDGGNGMPQFTQLSPEYARTQGITESERLAFNSEPEEVNAVTQQMALDVAKAIQQGARGEEVVAIARASATVNGAGLQPGTRAALRKIADRAFAE